MVTRKYGVQWNQGCFGHSTFDFGEQFAQKRTRECEILEATRQEKMLLGSDRIPDTGQQREHPGGHRLSEGEKGCLLTFVAIMGIYRNIVLSLYWVFFPLNDSVRDV